MVKDIQGYLIGNMRVDCLAVEARFPVAGFALHHKEPCCLQWDCHHGTTFILRVAGLSMTKVVPDSADSSILIKISLQPREKFVSEAERFAAHHGLEISRFSVLPPTLPVPALLSAAHLPEAGLFVFSEKSALTARSADKPQCELTVTGPFQVRRIPSLEADLIIHLDKPASARLLSFLLARAQA